jgi:hypothetical protein
MKILKKLYYIWLKIGEVLGWVWTRVILTTVYFIVLGPISIIIKIFGKDPLKLKFQDNSYWLPKQKRELKEEDYYHQF